MNKICFVTNKYPNKVEPNGLVFLQQLIWEMAEQDINCTVICPISINFNFKYLKIPNYIQEKTHGGKNVNVYFPKIISLGQSKKILGFKTATLTTSIYTHIVKKLIKKNKLEFDVVYGHFITPAGITSARIGEWLNVPSFFAYGESTLWSIEQYGLEKVKKELKNITGVVSVSTENKEILERLRIADERKIKVFPNGYNKERFYKIDKEIARKKMGWSNDDYIVGFCGSFIERKGIIQLEKAIDMINKENIKFACAGKGKLIPASDKCILKTPIKNEDLVYFYNAIDIFCLPTQNEGCCNAIIEAMACGCPIISSDKKFNTDILDESNAILVNPNNVEEIKDAILELIMDDKKRMLLSEESLNRAKELSLEERAKNIISFLKERRNR